MMMCIYYGQIGMHTNKHVSKIFKGRFFCPKTAGSLARTHENTISFNMPKQHY